MGVSRHVYVGPAIRLSETLVTINVEMPTCSNDSCKNHGKRIGTQFCSMCGSPVLYFTKQEQHQGGLRLFVYDESGKYEKYEDFMYQPEYTRFAILPNHSVEGLGKYHGDFDDSAVWMTDISTETQAAQIKVFEDHYAEMLKDMREFGLEFTVEYGVVMYHS
jgi:hypothetical protein